VINAFFADIGLRADLSSGQATGDRDGWRSLSRIKHFIIGEIVAGK
jgi:hypothetical protein